VPSPKLALVIRDCLCQSYGVELVDHPDAPYSYIPGIDAYSAGVIAHPGFELIHITLRRPEAWQSGIEEAIAAVEALDLPINALCAFELRCPTPHSFEGFGAFNDEYRTVLGDAGLLLKRTNPIARTNVAPVVDPPEFTQLYGFTFVSPMDDEVDEWDDDIEPSFVVAGAGDLVDQADLRPEAIVGSGQEDSKKIRSEKMAQVIGVMEERMATLGVGWDDVTIANVYTAGALGTHLAGDILAPMGQHAAHGVHWHYSHPPISGLTFEMDVRGIGSEQWV
jgi:hypothetical protein